MLHNNKHLSQHVKSKYGPRKKQQNSMFALYAVMTILICLLTCVCVCIHTQQTKRGHRRPYLPLCSGRRCVYTAVCDVSSACVSYDVSAPLMKWSAQVYVQRARVHVAAILCPSCFLSDTEDQVTVSYQTLHVHAKCAYVCADLLCSLVF